MGLKSLTKLPVALALLLATLMLSLGGYFGDFGEHGFRDEQLTKRGHGKLISISQHRIGATHQKIGNGNGTPDAAPPVLVALLKPVAEHTVITGLPVADLERTLVSKRWLLLCSLII